jgi:hypothetical protein
MQATAQVVNIKRAEYPRSESPIRHFRLWDAKSKQEMRWRYYGDLRHAHIAALIEARWADVGTTIEVYDCRNGRMYGQYTRKPTTVAFLGGDNV